MKKIILLAMVYTGFVVTTPFTAQAIDSEKIGQNLDSHSERLRQREPNMAIAQYRRNQNRDRQFSVYYRNRGDRQWTREGSHTDRRDAERAARRLEQRGYKTYVQVSREVNRGMMGRDRGMMNRDMMGRDRDMQTR
jgi:hypothetical protein